MADYNCSACSELREDAPNFINYGLTSTEVTSLQNNTGLNPSSGNDDCTDLNDMNDCLIGNMETEIDAYDVCDWKTFMKRFIGNVWTVIKGIICSICGLWEQTSRTDCIVDYLTEGARFQFGEFTDTGSSYIVAGKGVSFANISATGTSADITLTYIAGGLSSLSGSCLFYSSDFTDAQAVANFDNSGVNPTTSASRKGNSVWGESGYLGSGGELVYELRIKKSEYPQIQTFFSGLVNAGAGGLYTGQVVVRGGGTYAPGQHGWCDMYTGDPSGTGSDRGHLVPDGWIYIQIRLKELVQFSANGSQYSPVALIPMRINQSAISC